VYRTIPAAGLGPAALQLFFNIRACIGPGKSAASTTLYWLTDVSTDGSF